MNFVDLYGWRDGFTRAAKQAGDKPRQELAALPRRAWAVYETDTRQAEVLLREARALADQLGEPCWQLYTDTMLIDLYLGYRGDVSAGLSMAVRTAVEARKPAYKGCPMLGRVYWLLTSAYSQIDPVGYAAKIFEALDYAESKVALDVDSWQLFMFQRAYVLIMQERLDEAFQAAQSYMERVEHMPAGFQNACTAAGCRLLCLIGFQCSDWLELARYAEQGALAAQRAPNTKRHSAEFALWQAVCARKMGDETAARRQYTVAVADMGKLDNLSSEYYYQALCAYLEAGGNYENALHVRGRELDGMIASGSVYRECQCRLERCRLLVLLGLPNAAERAAARAAAQKLIDPAAFLQKLERV